MGSGPASGVCRSSRGAGKPGRARLVGLRILVPGYAQWSWEQHDRALVFFGSFAAALGVAVFAWGTRTGAGLLLFAFAMHVAATADVIRQASFPGFGRWVPPVSASVGLGLGCYGPALVLASALAWPGLRLGSAQEGFLINRWAYQVEEPAAGQWVWFRSPEGRGQGVTQVLASAGQGVEWSGGRLWVGGQPQAWTPARTASPPSHLAMTVPDGFLLVEATSGLTGEGSCGMALLPRDHVVGRAWARMYPIRGRRLLY